MNAKHIKTLAHFEAEHAQPKLKRMQAALAAEKAKVEALAGKADQVHVFKATDENTIRFAVCGDTQAGSLYAATEQFSAFCVAAKERGCEIVLHTGDVLDGWKVYRGQEFELRDVGFDAQIARLAEMSDASATLPVAFITGNHDLSFKTLAGVNVGGAISDAAGWRHLGDEHATVELRTKDGTPYTVGLYHNGGGTSYALSYRIQKSVEALEGGRKPQMACYGHYHKAEFIPSYRNVAAIQSGCFQWQTPFMARMALAAHVGGWIVEVTPGETWNRVRAEFIAFYR